MKIRDLKVNYHAHSIYSNLDAVSTPKDYIEYDVKHDVEYQCLTDHGHISGMYELFTEANKNGIRPVCGCEFYVSLGSDYGGKDVYGHLTTMAYTQEGIKNIYRLYNKSWNQLSKARWGHKKPTLSWSDLEDHRQGIFVGTSCLVGCVGRHIMKGRPDLAEKDLCRLIDLFGKDNIFAEFMPGSAAWDYDPKIRDFKPNPECLPFAPGGDYVKGYQLWLWDIAVLKYKLKPVVTTDSHFVYPQEKKTQDLVLQASEGGWHFHGSLHVPSKEEIYHGLSYLPGHGETLHDALIINGLEFGSKIEYKNLGVDSTPKLPNTFKSDEHGTEEFLKYVRPDRFL